jgi:hypothetical protein
MVLSSSSVQPSSHAEEVAVEIRHAEQVLGDIPDAVALQRAPFDLGFELFAELAQLAFDDVARVLGLHAFHGKAELARQGQRQIDILAGKFARRVVIGHELADELAAGHHRDEGKRADAFLRHDSP